MMCVEIDLKMRFDNCSFSYNKRKKNMETQTSTTSCNSVNIIAINTIKILEFLKDKETDTQTLIISKHIYGKNASRKTINPTIYEMSKNGLVEKECNQNGGDPKWKITQKGKDLLISSTNL